MTKITSLSTHDLRFPTSASLDGSDAMNPDPDYSAAYVILGTDGAHEGHGLTFTIGRGNEVVVAAIRALAGSPARWQSAGAEPGADFWYRAGRVMNRQGLAPVPLAGTRFDNPVLGLTAAAAAAALAACGVDGRFLAEAARRFEPLPHRLQEIGEAGGIRWVDDSKATNLAALMAALSLARAPVRLIAGGRAKGESYEPARGLLSQKVAAAYLIGESAGLMAEAWRGATRCVLSGALEQAVAEAAREARSGETILLSPACASFDQYPGYAERGAAFARAAQKILDTMSANSDSPSADFMARKNV